MRFVFPIDIAQLQNDQLKLVPFENKLETWRGIYMEENVADPEMLKWLPYGPLTNTANFMEWYDARIVKDDASCIFAITLKAGSMTRYDAAAKTTETSQIEDGTFAGVVGLLNANVEHSMVEVGHVVIFPRFRRSFVGTHTQVLMLRHLLNDREQGGLGLRRVQWQANASNEPSIQAAQRLGFRLEGIKRWDRVLQVGKFGGEDMREEGRPNLGANGQTLGPGRHTAVLSLCWDDWLEGGRQRLDRLLKKYS